ncbi:glycosyltransferase [Priestia megaterium]|uniref:glycosyltransferase n=1 Tax=Priestia megaterium TaxID=1404 RepID=UPI00398FF51C
MKKVLFVSYLFPPIGMSQRTLKFVKYLPEFGWIPVVLAPEKSNYIRFDPTMVKEIPSECIVKRIPFCEEVPGNPLVTQHFLKKGWYPLASKIGTELIRQENIDMIYTTSAPYISHSVGFNLKTRTQKPWIADFRDEWTTNPFIKNHYKGELLEFNKRLEKKVLKNADTIISVSPHITNTLYQLSEEKLKDKFYTIMNGYDKQDIEQITPKPITNKFRICYMGSLYGMIKTLAMEFFNCLDDAISQKKLNRQEIELSIISDPLKQIRPNLLEITNNIGYLPHIEALNHAASADLILLFIHPGQGDQTVTSKIFELINLKKPILALVPPNGEAANIIRKTETGVVIDSNTPEKCIPYVIRYFNLWKQGKNKISPNLEEIQKYDRKKLTQELAKIMDSIVNIKD